MTLRSSASEVGLVASTDENGIARGCGRATTAEKRGAAGCARGSGAAGGGVEGHGEGGGGGECRFTRVLEVRDGEGFRMLKMERGLLFRSRHCASCERRKELAFYNPIQNQWA
jgi:hypothetical protein